ncbi:MULTISPECIES: hypothetical protein [Thalassospira]|nr:MULTISPECIES: hypothetical protein [Thalassospira]NJB75705.1 hypothetical protein [Thalassospira tepidiphila]|tara:strand:- start:3562 stop:4962 length:1401 start_codon:yes stop_codon:yes gene_type:complete
MTTNRETRKSRVFIVPTLKSQLQLTTELASRLQQQRIKVTLCTPNNSGLTQEIITISKKTNSTINNREHINTIKNFCENLYLLALSQLKYRAAPMRSRIKYLRTARDFFQKKKIAKLEISKSQSTHLICFEDGISSPFEYISAAIELKIPVIVVPYEISNHQDFQNLLLEKYADGTLYEVPNSALGQLIRSKHAQWIKTYKRKNFLLFPPEYILAREDIIGELQNPWTVHGGPSSYIAVESENTMRVYRDENIDEKKLVPTGSIYCDLIYEKISEHGDAKRAFENKKKIAPNKTKILVSLPPNYHATRAKFCEFESYSTVWQQLKRLEDENEQLEISVSIHPNTLDSDREVINNLNLNTIENGVITAIPVHDLFFTCFSSTIRWALAAGKPVINYDMYGFNLSIYDNSPGFFSFANFSNSKEKVLKMLNNEYYETQARGMEENRKIWGEIDGRATENIVRLITEHN